MTDFLVKCLVIVVLGLRALAAAVVLVDGHARARRALLIEAALDIAVLGALAVFWEA